MADSTSHSDVQLLPAPEPENQLSSLIDARNFERNIAEYKDDMTHELQGAMVNMLNMISDINQNSSLIVEELEKCKDSALERKKVLDEEKERFQKAAYAVLDMLDHKD